MLKWFPVMLALLVSACSSTPDTRYYQLPVADSKVAVSSRTFSHPVWVEHVAVPDFLAGNGVAWQKNDVQYVIASSNLWASPLDQQLQQTLVTNLSTALPGSLVSSSALGQQYDTLNVTINGFHGRYDGHAIVSGEWVFEHDGKLIKQPFSLALPQKEDGYDALVRNLAAGWQQVAVQIAQAINYQQ